MKNLTNAILSGLIVLMAIYAMGCSNLLISQETALSSIQAVK